jgi:hypothetical protein
MSDADYTTTVGTMSTLGWVTDPALKIDRLFSYWLASEDSQSYIYYGKIFNFQRLIVKYDGQPELLASAVAQQLTEMLDGHFPGQVSVTADPKDLAEYGGRYHLNINVSLSLNDKLYDVPKTLEVDGTLWKQLNIRD